MHFSYTTCATCPRRSYCPWFYHHNIWWRVQLLSSWVWSYFHPPFIQHSVTTFEIKLYLNRNRKCKAFIPVCWIWIHETHLFCSQLMLPEITCQVHCLRYFNSFNRRRILITYQSKSKLVTYIHICSKDVLYIITGCVKSILFVNVSVDSAAN